MCVIVSLIKASPLYVLALPFLSTCFVNRKFYGSNSNLLFILKRCNLPCRQKEIKLAIVGVE